MVSEIFPLARAFTFVAKQRSDPRANIARDRRRCNSPARIELLQSRRFFISLAADGIVWDLGLPRQPGRGVSNFSKTGKPAGFYLANVNLAVWQAFSAGDPVKQDDYLGVAGNFLDDFLQLLGHQRRGLFADELAKRYGETRIVKRLAHRCL